MATVLDFQVIYSSSIWFCWVYYQLLLWGWLMTLVRPVEVLYLPAAMMDWFRNGHVVKRTIRLDMEFLFLNWYSWWCELMWALMMREAHYMKHESETNPQEAEPSNDFLGPHLSPESIHMGNLIHSCIFQSCVPVRSSSSFFSFSSSSSSSSSSYLYLGFCYLSYN